MLPKKIVQDGEVHDINPEIVKEKLLEIKHYAMCYVLPKIQEYSDLPHINQCTYRRS